MPKFDSTLWHRLLDVLNERHGPICRQWFYDDLEPGKIDAGLLEIHTRTTIQQNYLQKTCLEPFTEAAQDVTGQLVAVRFICDPDAVMAEPQAEAIEAGVPSLNLGVPADDLPPLPVEAGVEVEYVRADPIDLENESMVLSPDYSFDNFISGPNNQLAYAAAVAVANQPGTAYNPLFIHGGVGLGKTHLLQAICQSILSSNPSTQILYVSCDAFMNQFIQCVQSGQMNEFRHRYRDIDLLVIDDIHFLAKRERSQEEFFHTFNELYQSNRQIVLSSDAAPHEIPNLEERLVSRFSWGLVSPVTKPDYETRVAILNAKAKLRGQTVPTEIIEYVAHVIDSNARELEGALNTLLGHAKLCKRPLDLRLAREALGEAEPAPVANHTTLQHIVDAVTNFYSVKLSDLQSRRRTKSITEPRQICMWLARKRTRFSLEEIGGFFGGRDHTTVMHSIEVVGNRIKMEPSFKPHLEQLLNKIDRATGAST